LGHFKSQRMIGHGKVTVVWRIFGVKVVILTNKLLYIGLHSA